MHRTILLNKGRTKNVTTKFGQRRILKNPNPNGIATYIRQAVQAGTYYDYELERRDLEKQKAENQGPSRRGQFKKMPNVRVSPYGQKIQDYPKVYEILNLNPIPEEMLGSEGIDSKGEKQLTKKEIRFLKQEQEALKRMKEQQREKAGFTKKKSKRDDVTSMEPLLKKYLKNEINKQRGHTTASSSSDDDNTKEKIDDIDLYYKKLLGIPKPKSSSAMGSKSSLVNKAYTVAVKQFELLRSDPNMSEEESLKIVEELLQKDLQKERQDSRHKRNTIVEEMEAKSNEKEEEITTAGENKKKESLLTSAMPPPKSKSKQAKKEDGKEDGKGDDIDLSSVPSILHNKPRTIQGMFLWSQRLKAVPYNEWTIGASVALDHWIARSILQINEETWMELLNGSNADLKSIGLDIIQIRTSLFPETSSMGGGGIESDFDEHDDELLSSLGDDDDEKEDEKSSSIDDKRTAADKSIDELLASLGGFDTKTTTTDSTDTDSGTTAASYVDDDDDWDDNMPLDDKIVKLVDKLQVYRRKHHTEMPYEQWPIDEQNEFNNWLRNKYIKIVLVGGNEYDMMSSSFGGGNFGDTDVDITKDVDIDTTRERLLGVKPTTKEVNDKFFTRIQDEANAEILLNEMLKNGPPSTTNDENNEERDLVDRYISKFWTDLSYNEQIQRLVELGTIQPLIDEYCSETTRQKFLKRHGPKLLEGIEMEHLIEDNVNGQIKGSDIIEFMDKTTRGAASSVRGARIGDDSLESYDYSRFGSDDNNDTSSFDNNNNVIGGIEIKEESRYVIKKIPFGTDEFNHTESQRSRQLYELWNTHKVNRSLYEEYMFKEGLLGLTYKDKKNNNNNKDKNDDDEKTSVKKH